VIDAPPHAPIRGQLPVQVGTDEIGILPGGPAVHAAIPEDEAHHLPESREPLNPRLLGEQVFPVDVEHDSELDV